MWKKKTEKEINDELKVRKIKDEDALPNKIIKIGIWSFIGIFLFRLIEALTLGLNYNPNKLTASKTIRFDQIPEYYSEFMLQAFIFAVLIMIIRALIPSIFHDKSSSLMCEKCHKTVNYTNNKKCSCGGNLLPIENFKWIEKETKKIKIENWINKHKIEKTKG